MPVSEIQGPHRPEYSDRPSQREYESETAYSADPAKGKPGKSNRSSERPETSPYLENKSSPSRKLETKFDIANPKSYHVIKEKAALVDRNYYRPLLANAMPECDFKYRSNALAFVSESNAR